MDVYDFDKTLYRGDSTADFLRFCLRRHPRIARTLPRTALAAAACFGLGAIGKTQFKAALYRFLPLLPDVERDIGRFWALHASNIAGPCTPRPGDLVISAGPEFLLEGVCAERSLSLIASKVDPHTGHVLSPNCSNAEKVTRFRARYPEAVIARFYSDSLDDTPLAALAEKAYLVKGGALVPWPAEAGAQGGGNDD